MKQIVRIDLIEDRIFFIRGHKVMLDRDLAALYGVETRVLNQAVHRNKSRFPSDFMFRLSKDEMEKWISQIVISKWEKMGIRKKPYVFTEQGIAMLSGVLNSRRAIQVNIQIMRAFIRLRTILASHKELARKLEDLEKKYDRQFKIVFQAIHRLIVEEEKPKRRIGFHP